LSPVFRAALLANFGGLSIANTSSLVSCNPRRPAKRARGGRKFAALITELGGGERRRMSPIAAGLAALAIAARFQQGPLI